MSEWQPIETAPKDGTEILIFTPQPYNQDKNILSAYWVLASVEWWEEISPDTKKLRIDDESHWDCYESPTHWMPLPPPPESKP